MSDLVITENDQAVFMPNFKNDSGIIAIVMAPGPGIMQASGETILSGKKICLKDDEKNLTLENCVYITTQHSLPGLGTLTIDELGGDQVTKKAKSGGKPIILKGTTFTAKFTVRNQAKQPPKVPGDPVIPDAAQDYTGSGKFITTNTKFTAS